MSILDYFLAGGWQKKAPAQEDTGAYTFKGKNTTNFANCQTFAPENTDEVFAALGEEWEAEATRRDAEWRSQWTPTATAMVANETPPIMGDEVQHTAPPLRSLHQEPVLPIYGLPAFFQQYADNVTTTYQCPQEFVVGAMLSAVSTAVGNRMVISTPKYKRKPLSLWVATVAPSGSNKSEPVEEVMRPLISINAKLAQEYARQVQEIKKRGSDEPLPTLKRQLISGDITPEARTEAMNNNPSGICQYEDEISTIFLNQNRYTQSAGVIDLLKVWDGRTLQSDRKSKDNPSLLITRPFLNILGNIQPEYIKDIFGEKRYIASGFNARWNFLFPGEVSDEPLNDAVCDEHLRAQWEWCITTLQTIEDGTELVVDGEAYNIYKEYHANLQEKKEGKQSYERSIYSKLQIQVLRIAGVVHCMSVTADALRRWSAEIYDTLHVTPEEMRYAVDCMAYFEHSAKKVMDILCPSSKNDGTRLNNKQLIKLMFERFTIPNKQAFADAINVSRPYVSGIINEK